MNRRLVIIILFSAVVGGCTSDRTAREHPLAERERRLKAVEHITVPLPEITPFDSDADARRAYLEFYSAGYKDGLAGYSSSCCLLDVPHREARVAGWYDGSSKGWKVWADRNLVLKTNE